MVKILERLGELVLRIKHVNKLRASHLPFAYTPKQKQYHINKIPLRINYIKNLPSPNMKLKQYTKDNRKAGHLLEVVFWQQVHKRKLHAIDFDRQIILANYIVDFYVKGLGLVVEIDGSSHDDREEYDAERTRFLESFGIVVYRITNGEILNNLDSVMLDLERFILSNRFVVLLLLLHHPEFRFAKPTPPRHSEVGNLCYPSSGVLIVNEDNLVRNRFPSIGGGEAGVVNTKAINNGHVHNLFYKKRHTIPTKKIPLQKGTGL